MAQEKPILGHFCLNHKFQLTSDTNLLKQLLFWGDSENIGAEKPRFCISQSGKQPLLLIFINKYPSIR
jgi:hypothetical protein